MEFEKITVLSNDETFIESMKFNSMGRDEALHMSYYQRILVIFK